MPTDSVTQILTGLSYQQASSICRDVLESGSKNVEFEKLGSANDPFAGIDGQRLGVFATGVDGTIAKKRWGLKMEIYDRGDHREILLGTENRSVRELLVNSFAEKNFWDRSEAVGKVNFNKKVAENKVELIVGSLRSSDPNLKVS